MLERLWFRAAFLAAFILAAILWGPPPALVLACGLAFIFFLTKAAHFEVVQIVTRKFVENAAGMLATNASLQREISSARYASRDQTENATARRALARVVVDDVFVKTVGDLLELEHVRHDVCRAALEVAAFRLRTMKDDVPPGDGEYARPFPGSCSRSPSSLYPPNEVPIERRTLVNWLRKRAADVNERLASLYPHTSTSTKEVDDDAQQGIVGLVARRRQLLEIAVEVEQDLMPSNTPDPVDRLRKAAEYFAEQNVDRLYSADKAAVLELRQAIAALSPSGLPFPASSPEWDRIIQRRSIPTKVAIDGMETREQLLETLRGVHSAPLRPIDRKSAEVLIALVRALPVVERAEPVAIDEPWSTSTMPCGDLSQLPTPNDNGDYELSNGYKIVDAGLCEGRERYLLLQPDGDCVPLGERTTSYFGTPEAALEYLTSRDVAADRAAEDVQLRAVRRNKAPTFLYLPEPERGPGGEAYALRNGWIIKSSSEHPGKLLAVTPNGTIAEKVEPSESAAGVLVQIARITGERFVLPNEADGGYTFSDGATIRPNPRVTHPDGRPKWNATWKSETGNIGVPHQDCDQTGFEATSYYPTAAAALEAFIGSGEGPEAP